MKKKTWLIAGLSLLAAGTLAVGLAGCSSGYTFEKYSYNQGGTSEKDWRALEYPDTDMKMDGVVDEAAYGEGFLSFSDVNGVNMKVHAHMGAEGVFFGFVSDDQNVNYNTNNDIFNNTSVEIQVAPFGTEKLNVNVIQLRLGTNGTSEQWIGFRADNDAYDYTKKYLPSMGTVHVNGELNGTADGYSAELYLPYTSIGLSEKPASVICAPSFNTLPTRSDANRATWTMMLGCDLGDPATWYVVDGTGMTPHTAGFTETDSGVTQTGGHTQVYYAGSAAQPSYYLKASLTQKSFLNGDAWPKFGLVNKSDDALQCFYIDASQKRVEGNLIQGTHFGTVHARPTTNGGTDLLFSSEASSSFDAHWTNAYIEGYDEIEMETIYYGGDLYFVLDDVLVQTVHGFSPPSEGAVPGFWCMNTALDYDFEEGYYVTDAAEVKAEAERFIAKDKKIDGDLSDWTDEEINRRFISATDSGNGNSMKVRAFRGTDGLYIAYNIHHRTNAPVSKWDDGWWLNTNIEFKINTTKEKDHYALTTFGTGGYMDAVMTTVRDENREYNTVAEIFVPFTTLIKDGYNRTDPLKVGFAFKVKHENATDDDKLNGSNWWYIGGAPDNVANYHQVLEEGIGTKYTLTYASGEGEGDDITEEVFGGDVITLPGCPETFSKAGYRFLNWSDGSARYSAGAAYTMPNEATTLTAMWIDEGAADTTYHVTYQKGDGEVTGEVPTDGQDYNAGETFRVAEKGTLARAGYRFMGWQDQDGETYTAGENGNIVDKDLTLTAVWAQEFTLTYSAADADAATVPEAEKRVKDEEFSLSGTIPTKSGFTFAGWKYAAGGDRIYAAGDDFKMPEADVTLEAQWSATLTVDGDLTDWTELGAKMLSAHSLTDNRGAIWYGVLRSDGLYLAAEFFHNEEPFTDAGVWYDKLNFEVRIKNNANGATHWYISVNGNSGDGYTGVLGCDADGTEGASGRYTHESLTGGRAAHRSVFELFIPAARFAGLKEADGSLRVGLAVKTGDYASKERITGGNVNYESGDTWYAPLGVQPDDPVKYAYVTNDGLYLRDEHDNPDVKFGIENAADDGDAITVDGVLTDWAGVHTIKVEGTETYAGKSATFYGKLTKKGLYVAVEAYHGVFTTTGDAWHKNTNFELQIGSMFNGGRISAQHWVSATGDTAFDKSHTYMQVALKHESAVGHDNATQHTIVEFFIPAANLPDAMIRDGSIRVGVAWKTPGDQINNNSVGNGGVDEWWNPQGENVNDTPTYVDGDGMYLASEYAEKQ